MKRYIILILLLSLATLNLYAQRFDYNQEWKKVEDLLYKQGRPQSAVTEIRKIYNQAKKENNQGQYVKALAYLFAAQQMTREDHEFVSLKELDTEIASSREPATSLLKAMKAGMLWRYFQNNRWNLYNRTSTIQFVKDDLKTWSAQDFHSAISRLYLESISNDRILKQTSLTAFEPVIHKGNMRHLRPTLFDLLAHHALQYFKNDERDLNRPAYAFVISDSMAFAPATAFVNYRFTTRDTASLHYKAITIYQQLIAFHLQQRNAEALNDVDLERIRFVHQHATLENKDRLYLRALRNVADRAGRGSPSNQALYLVAEHYFSQGIQYSPNRDTTNRWAKVEARKILADIVRDSTVKNEGWVNSYNLLRQIDQQALSFQVEKINLPGQPMRTLFKFTNLNQVHFRVIRVTAAIKRQLEENRNAEFWKLITQADAIERWTQQLPDPKDHQQHAVELKVPALPKGNYILIASSGSQFAPAKDLLGMQMFSVSEIAYVNKEQAFFVLHRSSGEPLEKARIEVYERTYDYQRNRSISKLTGSFTTDAKGFARIRRQSNDYGSYFIKVFHGQDSLVMEDQYYGYYDNRREQTAENSLFFFTDRSIYRPGQILHFKAIALSRKNNKSNIVANTSFTIYLRDANYQIVDSLKLMSNEFGSIAGRFQLPQTGLTGMFYLMDREQRSTAAVSVEEYKRPTFFAEFIKNNQEYRLSDSVTVTGRATAYAGNAMSGAAVSYRVVRNSSFPYPMYGYRIWPPRTPPAEIAHGIATTDANGNFTVKFHLLPDQKLDPAHDPVFTYTIYADVTAPGGETRSTSSTISAAYKSMIISVDIPGLVHADSLRNIMIHTRNLDGQFIASRIQVSLIRLLPEQRLIRNRYWERPDLFVMSKDEFIRNFPNDEYEAERDPSSWPKGETIYTRSDSAAANGIFSLNATIPPGYYEVTVTSRDRDGREVKTTSIVEVYNNTSQTAIPRYLVLRPAKGPAEPGQVVTNEVISSVNLHLVKHVERQDQPDAQADMETLRFTGSRKFSYSVTEADRGGFGIHYFTVRDNRVHIATDIIQVPWTNKELVIHMETFREKTLPGSAEKWKVRISGKNNEKLAAEMLASMYDASLDQFSIHNWNRPGIWNTFQFRNSWSGQQNFSAVHSNNNPLPYVRSREFRKEYDRLNFLSGEVMEEGYMRRMDGAAPGVVTTAAAAPQAREMKAANGEAMQEMEMAIGVDDSARVGDDRTASPQSQFQPRTNFNETAFFFPELRTNADGSIEFSFTMPEALTSWKMQLFAHTRELAMGLVQKEIITQKELMVQPNAPRFIRQGDRIEFTTRIANVSDREITGQVQLQLIDAITGQAVDGWFMNSIPNQYFTVAAGTTEAVSFPIQVPYQFSNAVRWRIVASGGQHSDGEENIIPVLSNRMLVTESLVMHMRGDGNKTYSFDKLKNNNSSTLQHHSVTVEYAANPTWFVVQALPFLAEVQNESAEQAWNRYYANALAAHIARSNPRLKQVFDLWMKDSSALLSNLHKNAELKNILLQETPWVMAAQSESEQRKNISLLFNMEKMAAELQSSLEKLKQMQAPNGGFVWFKGGPEDRYMTQYIVTGIGRLKQLGFDVSRLQIIYNPALNYLDRKLKDDYDRLVKNKADLKKQQVGHMQLQYLYMRSFFGKPGTHVQTAFNYYLNQSKQFWVQQNHHIKGMIALTHHRAGDKTLPSRILVSLKETSINSEEMGRYWKENRFGYSWSWWHAPIETQALIIEAFAEIAQDRTTVDDLKTWLVKNKQTTHWRTSKATADACYAMLLRGSDWIAAEPIVKIQLGDVQINSRDQGAEAGTGYFKTRITESQVKNNMGNIGLNISNTGAGSRAPSWGAVYWQYFEDMDKITSATTPLALNKKLFIEVKTDRGPVLKPVTEGMELKVGDKIVTRIELRADRDMEYVHMKDMRASAFEPVNVLSGYKWQGGLGYYESTRDASTSFFFSYLPKGTYVFEYPVFVTHKGNFNNGITTIQSLYAPEFLSHSEGVKVRVD